MCVFLFHPALNRNTNNTSWFSSIGQVGDAAACGPVRPRTPKSPVPSRIASAAEVAILVPKEAWEVHTHMVATAPSASV